MDEYAYIAQTVHALYYGQDLNCARTTMHCLSHLLHVPIEPQTVIAAVGMHGAGGYRAQCGLVEGALMFLGIYFAAQGRKESEAVAACRRFAERFEQEFGALRCRELRPQGFSPEDPPHMCENLTCRAIFFSYQFLISEAEAWQTSE